MTFPITVVHVANLSPDMENLYIVDAKWPKELSRYASGVTQWLKAAAPAEGLVTWLRQDPLRWPTFCEVYWSDLANNPHRWEALREAVSRQPVILVHANDSDRYNPAMALARFIEQQLATPDDSTPQANKALS